MSENRIMVAVRLRPFNARERELSQGKCKSVIDMVDGQTIIQQLDGTGRKVFGFDYNFLSLDPKDSRFASQDTVFESVGQGVLKNAFDGYNACIFAYGQTGSGKSYSMMGAPGSPGIIPRLCTELFERTRRMAEENQNLSFQVEVSYLEIHNEKVFDLLDKSPNKIALKVRGHPETGAWVENLTFVTVTTFEEIDNLIIEGNKTRTVAATAMNSESSRSHAVFNITFLQTSVDKDTKKKNQKVSKISLVDLAGSERASKTGASGALLKEGANINKSLTTLGICIAKLAEGGDTFVPYRDSVLTWLLKESLGGNSRTVMVAALSPSPDNYDETLSTLRFADRAKHIVCHAVVNEDPNIKLIRDLRALVEDLKEQLAGLQSGKGGDAFARTLELTEHLMTAEGPRYATPKEPELVDEYALLEEEHRANEKQLFDEIVSRLKTLVDQANGYVTEANRYANEFGQKTTFAVTLQLPTGCLSFIKPVKNIVCDPAIVASEPGKPDHMWSLERLEVKLADMRLLSEKLKNVAPAKRNAEPYLTEVRDIFCLPDETDLLLGVANLFLDALIYNDLKYTYLVPVISQQGKEIAQLEVELSRQEIPNSKSSSGGEESMEAVCKVKIIRLCALPSMVSPSYFCTYRFCDETVYVPATGVEEKSVRFDNTKEIKIEMDDTFINTITEGVLPIEVWYNQKGPKLERTKESIEKDEFEKMNDFSYVWKDISRRLIVTVEIQELNNNGNFTPVEVLTGENLCGGVYQLKQGVERRWGVRVKPMKTGLLPIIVDKISSFEIGSIQSCSSKTKYDSYQDNNLIKLKDKWKEAFERKKEFLESERKTLSKKKNKSADEKEREKILIRQWVDLAVQNNAFELPRRGTGVPGAQESAYWKPPMGCERKLPIMFLDLKPEEYSSAQLLRKSN